jgi:putative ABC transport system permease protein
LSRTSEVALQDLRYGLRRLLKSPGWSAVVVLTLALGIGANTAIFSVVDAVLLRPLPYRAPERLVSIDHFYPSLNGLKAPISAPGFRDYSQRRHVFSGFAVENGWMANLTGSGEPQRLIGVRVSGSLFPTLGVRAARGRTLLPGEDRAGHDRVVVLSYGLWQRLFGGDPGAVGRRLLINGESYEVVGVMPASFRDFFSRAVELWAPLTLKSEEFADANRTNESLVSIARLRPGVPLAAAQADLRAFAGQLKRQYPDRYPRDWSLLVTPLAEKATGNLRPALLVLLAAVGFVLLIACANVANLLLARAATRLKEIAVRTAIGASRARLLRQLLTESLILALAGGALGLLLAVWGVRAGVALAATDLPFLTDVRIDAAVLAWSLGLSLLAGLLFGLAPALQTVRADPQQTLREGGRGAGADRTGRALRSALAVAEVAIALALLACAGLFLKSFSRLQRVDPGFDPERVLTFNLALPQTKYPTDPAQIAFFDQVRVRLAAVPGVRAVGATSVLPFSGMWSTGGFQIEGFQPPPNQPSPWGDIRFVSPGFFKALAVPLRKGRDFAEQDDDKAVKVAIVDDEMVRRYWPRTDPIGKRITFSGPGQPPEWIAVVGVVGHTKHEGLDADARVQVYLPYRQSAVPSMSFALRTAGPPLAVAPAVRGAVHAVDRDEPVSRMGTLRDLVESSVRQRRLSMLLLGFFAAIALLLATLGIYGVMSYAVTQRRHELGLRMALGAARPDVLALVLRQGMTLACAGLALGLAAALALGRLIASQLFEVQPTDPATFAEVTVLLALIAFVANSFPALRATRVDPGVALHEE